jgi:hypothetical protein
MTREDLLKIINSGNGELIKKSLLEYKSDFFNKVSTNNSEPDRGEDQIKTAQEIFNPEEMPF